MKYETIELFPAHLIEFSVEDLISQAIENLVALFKQSTPLVVAYSSLSGVRRRTQFHKGNFTDHAGTRSLRGAPRIPRSSS